MRFRALGAGDCGGSNPPRPAQSAAPELIANARAALCAGVTAERDARRFFETRFRPFRVVPENGQGFLTGYYEPCVPASRVETEEFRWPILARPTDLVTFGVDPAPVGFPKDISGARRLGDGSLVPYADRAQIEAERRDPIVWVRDAVEAFLMQVQGSAQVEFPDRSRARLAYDGRNGLPYTSIGKILIEAGEIAEGAMSLASLKAWLRRDSARGLDVMRRNRSFVFFQLVEDFDARPRPGCGRWRCAHPAALDRGRPDGLGLRPAVLDRRRTALGGRHAPAVPPAHDRPGHRLGDRGRGARRPLLRQRRCGGRTRRRHSPSGRVRRASAARGRAHEGHAAAPQAFAAPDRRGDRALDRGRALCRAAARRDPACAVESHEGRPAPCPAPNRR